MEQTERAGAGELPDGGDAQHADAASGEAYAGGAGDAAGAADFGEPGRRRHGTGEPRVDAALARLDELTGQPVTEHRAVFDDVHRRLREVLGELDTRGQQPGDGAGAERRAGH